MLPLHAKIDRTQRLLRMLEEDAPLLALRIAPLTAERQQSAKDLCCPADRARPRRTGKVDRRRTSMGFERPNARKPLTESLTPSAQP